MKLKCVKHWVSDQNKMEKYKKAEIRSTKYELQSEECEKTKKQNGSKVKMLKMWSVNTVYRRPPIRDICLNFMGEFEM